jgi:hypothetical protein
MNLAGSDRLRFDEGEIPFLVCEQKDGFRRVPAVTGKGLHEVPCAVGSTLMTINGQKVDPDLAGGGSALWVIAPRASAVSTATPLIRWHTLIGVKAYEVIVRGRGVEWTLRVTVDGDAPEASLRYPADAPHLQPGVHYKVIVVANGLRSDEADGRGAGFSLVDVEELKKVQADEAAIRELKLDAVSTAILVASRYAAAQLSSDAASILKASGIERNGEVARLLADIYASTGAWDEARLVLEGAASVEDTPVGRAQTFERLAHLASRTHGASKAWMEKAAEAWATAGDVEKAAALRSEIAKEKP